MELERITIAIEKDLVDRLDEIVARSGSGNRSETIRDLIRKRVLDEASPGAERRTAVGTVTLVYDHEKRELADRLLDAGHAHHGEILATLHVHLDERHCLEVVAMRGKVRELRHIAEHILGMKGVKHGQLVLSSAEI